MRLQDRIGKWKARYSVDRRESIHVAMPKYCGLDALETTGMEVSHDWGHKVLKEDASLFQFWSGWDFASGY